jgi:hypothetical protein
MDLQQCDQAVTGAKARITALQKAVADGEKQLSEAQSTLRNINDNIKFRESMKELVRVQDELDSIDVDAAKKASRRYEQDYERMRSDLGKNQSEEARLGGEIATMEEDRKEKMNELETEYKDIYVRFNTQLISNSVGRFFAHFLHPAPLTGGLLRSQTMVAANGDLEKFAKALDAYVFCQSLLIVCRSHLTKFDVIVLSWLSTELKWERLMNHSKLFGEKLIRERVSLVFSSNSVYQILNFYSSAIDIDKIMIKSDAEGKGVGGRSYNYRVRILALCR